MDKLTRFIAQRTLNHLAQLMGRRWECVGTPGTVIRNLITGFARSSHDTVTCPTNSFLITC